jgi:hypothetical protein
MAIEPWVRRRWPKSILGRLLAGSWRDPVVGRDVLLGVAWAWCGFSSFSFLHPMMHLGAVPAIGSTEYSHGRACGAGRVVAAMAQSIQTTLVFFLVLFGLKVILRKGGLPPLSLSPSLPAARAGGSYK